MPSRPTEHQDAVARRLALLSAELAGVGDPGSSAAPTLAPIGVVASPWVIDPVEPVSSVSPVDDPAPLLRPGRHASRRPSRSVVDAVPETLRGRVALGPTQVTLVAVLVMIGLAVTTLWVVHGDPAEVAAPVTARPAAGLATPALTAPETGPTPTGKVTVDVAGKVRRPGIVVLSTGSRVVDAIAAAGGARPRVDVSSLNLARVLVDGEQVVVGLPAPVPMAGAAGSAAPSAPGALVNLNTATGAELDTLPEVGPVTAAAIIAWRDEHGGFTSVDELLEVDGIGDATLATITPHVTV